ncbi:MAG: hypothetical protein L6R39_005217 [Caloplaca ligustica]|nr:MAG: hypothetical protein L6R39_005217 [Caloplaca ligustica]
MANWHTYTITNALSLAENEDNPPYSLPTPHVRRSIDILPETASEAAPVSTEALTEINVFDGTSLHLTTSTLPLTTKTPTTITTSGVTETLPGSTAVVPNDGMHAYPANGCWDDPKCWDSYTHSKAIATATNPAVLGYDSQTQPSVRKFFKDAAPFFALGIGVACLILFGFWLAFHIRARKQKKRGEEARERQSKRMREGEESSATAGTPPDEGIELEAMRREGQAIRQGVGLVRGSDTWATHGSTASEGWFRGYSEVSREHGRELEGRPGMPTFV